MENRTWSRSMTDIVDRKSEHIEIVLTRDVAGIQGSNGFDAVTFEHVALPEMGLDAVDLTTVFLGRTMRAPFLISSMTGGPARAASINAALAEAAGHLGIAFAVGSQRVALEAAGDGGLDKRLRQRAGAVPILANIGAAQLKTWPGVEMARRAVEMIDADALVIHLNPLQEAVQAGGDRDWSGLIVRIGEVARGLGKPVIAKEVGCGISGPLAQRLIDAGVIVIDVAGAGGTSWAAVEAERATDATKREIALAFRHWGIPTARAIQDVRAQCPSSIVIASGGIKNGVDAAKAIRLGADIVGQAAGVLGAALDGPEAVIRHFEIMAAQLRIACFCTGSADLKALRSARVLGGG
jgi:isopentenyl-diphosphate Delta-isomerase